MTTHPEGLTRLIECEECAGTGMINIPYATPACCGNVTDGGECRGDCSVPEWRFDQWEHCDECGGTGKARAEVK